MGEKNINPSDMDFPRKILRFVHGPPELELSTDEKSELDDQTSANLLYTLRCVADSTAGPSLSRLEKDPIQKLKVSQRPTKSSR